MFRQHPPAGRWSVSCPRQEAPIDRRGCMYFLSFNLAFYSVALIPTRGGEALVKTLMLSTKANEYPTRSYDSSFSTGLNLEDQV